jgi:hypothetical protein
MASNLLIHEGSNSSIVHDPDLAGDHGASTLERLTPRFLDNVGVDGH